MQHVAVVGNSCVDFINLRAPLLKKIQNCNSRVSVIGPECSDEKILVEMEKLNFNYVSYPIKPVSLNPLSDLKTFYKIYKILKDINPDKVLLLTLKPIVYGSIASKLNGISNVYSLNSGLGRIFVRQSFYQKFVLIFLQPMLKAAFRFNRKVFFQNPDDQKLFKSLKLCSQDQSIVVNGTGIDISHFPFNKFEEKKDLKFLMISRLIEEKGIIYFYEAAKKIKKLFPDVKFFLLGNYCDSKSGLSEEKIRTWQDEGIIDYLGETDDVRPFLGNADVFVLPTYYREGVPRTCMEALASGLPIITTDVPGCRETVINEESGFLIPPKDQEALNEAMLKFINEPSIISSMAEQGRRIVEEKFDINKVNLNLAKGMELI